MASSVVGTCRKRTPRRYVAATKPARSPTTPPPKATMQQSRPAPRAHSQSSTCALAWRDLGVPAGSASTGGTRAPAAWNAASSRSPCSRHTVSSVTTATAVSSASSVACACAAPRRAPPAEPAPASAAAALAGAAGLVETPNASRRAGSECSTPRPI